ncbi:MAG: DUF1800 domain-containing protein [Anaerolineae bacterium]|nr:DUF1800 domain-containing protein [Anaerolineae bacterium]
MQLSRGEFLRLAGLVSASAALQGCAPLYANFAALKADAPMRSNLPSPAGFPALNRLTFGPRQSELHTISELGLHAWIEQQLAPEQINDTAASLRIRHLDSLSQDANALEAREKFELISELKQATLLRQVYSKRQLYESMVEFWSDHFNISVAKGDCWFLKVVDDRQVIRKHALGSFRDLLMASAHSPAMLTYLDNQVNHKDAPNENYAREVMELHTLGVHGGYTQDDVMELARCLTGWSVKTHFWLGDFTFVPEMHAGGAKTVLGEVIPSAGIAEAEAVIDRLAVHPATAQHIATKLMRRFISDDPLGDAPTLVSRAASAFLQTKGDILSVLRVILLDGLATQAGQLPQKFKRPVNFVASALRSLEAETDANHAIAATLSQLGQPTFEWPTPDGPPDHAAAWSSNLLPRWQFALALPRAEIPGSRIDLDHILSALPTNSPADMIDRLSHRLLGAALPAETRRELAALITAQPAVEPHEQAAVITAGILASPAFQWR